MDNQILSIRVESGVYPRFIGEVRHQGSQSRTGKKAIVYSRDISRGCSPSHLLYRAARVIENNTEYGVQDSVFASPKQES